MSHPVPDPPGERGFKSKAVWAVPLTGMVRAVPLVGGGLEMLIGPWFRPHWNLRPDLFQYCAWGAIGGGVFSLLAGAYSWWAELRWVSVADDGLRWWKN